MKNQIAKNQLIGTGDGWAVFRDLYEDKDGNRESVHTSRVFFMQNERTLPSGKLTKYPPIEAMFAKHKLPGSTDGVW